MFDATDINVKELRVNGKPAEFSMSPGVFGTALSIVMPSDLEMYNFLFFYTFSIGF